MTAIFISHSSRDNDVALEIRDWLVEQGHRSLFLDFDPEVGIPLGRDWEQELYSRIRVSRAVISPSGPRTYRLCFDGFPSWSLLNTTWAPSGAQEA